MQTYYIEPVAAPRMTQRDRWKKRPCVERFYAYRDLIRTFDMNLPIPYKVTFYLPIPKSYSNKKKKELEGQPHLKRPDKDNLEKAFLDSVFGEDSHVWSGWAEKRYSSEPRIVVEAL